MAKRKTSSRAAVQLPGKLGEHQATLAAAGIKAKATPEPVPVLSWKLGRLSIIAQGTKGGTVAACLLQRGTAAPLQVLKDVSGFVAHAVTLSSLSK